MQTYCVPDLVQILAAILVVFSYKVSFECLRFRLCWSLSVNGRMTCVWRNCHLAVQKFSRLWKWSNGNLAGHFKTKNIYIFQCECDTQTQTETEGYRMHARRHLCIFVYSPETRGHKDTGCNLGTQHIWFRDAGCDLEAQVAVEGHVVWFVVTGRHVG